MRLFLVVMLAASLAVGAAAQVSPPPGVADSDVALGIRHVDEGDYDAAILVLDVAARRLAQQKAPSHVLSQAYLYLGIAYLAKGHETSAKARFRDALGQVRDLQVTPESFAPRVVEMFEKAREEMGMPPKKGGGGGLRQTNFPGEVVRAGAGRDFLVTATGTGNLTARVSYSPAGVLLSMYIVALSNTPQVLAEANQSGTTELTLTLPVTPQAYRISVTHSSGQGPQVDATFTLNVTHP